MYQIQFTPSAILDLETLKKSEQVTVLSEIDRQLLYEPIKQTRNRKPLQANDLAKWELRVNKFRVFYNVISDIEIQIVAIQAVGYKEGNRLFIRGQEYKL